MGIFDWPAPLARMIDSAFALVAGGSLRIVLWALFASALSMGLYRLTSNQKGLAEIKARIAAEKAKINDAPPEDTAAALAASKGLLVLSMQHVGRTLGPTLVAGLPVLFVFAFLSQTYSYVWPGGAPPVATVTYEDGRTDTLALSDPRLAQELEGAQSPGEPVPLIAKPSWTDAFFGNPAGYVKPQSEIRQVTLAVSQQRFLPFGPDWLAGWEALFLTLMVVISLAIKFVFRIE